MLLECSNFFQNICVLYYYKYAIKLFIRLRTTRWNVTLTSVCSCTPLWSPTWFPPARLAAYMSVMSNINYKSFFRLRTTRWNVTLTSACSFTPLWSPTWFPPSWPPTLPSCSSNDHGQTSKSSCWIGLYIRKNPSWRRRGHPYCRSVLC